MYYRPEFLVQTWAEYKVLRGIADDAAVDPAGFGAWGFEALLDDRLPRYQSLAERFGYTIEASELAEITDTAGFVKLVGKAIDRRMR